MKIRANGHKLSCLSNYLEREGLSQEEFAHRLKVSQGLISQWLAGETKVTAERAIEIEAATEGEITRHDLRPDLYAAESPTP